MPQAIEEYRAPLEALDQRWLAAREQPLVMRGLVAGWPAVGWARTSDMAFARGMARFDSGAQVDALLMPAGAEGRVGYSEDFDAFNYEHHRVSVTRVLKRLLLLAREDNPIGLAMQSALIERSVPGFLGEHGVPFLPASVRPRLWIGNRVTTPAHYDEFHNVACVACGRRRFTLFAPEQARNLYVGPLDFAPTGAAIGLARLDRPDDPRFPRLRAALDHALEAQLEPGDAIYIPPMWWHHVTSMTALNALVNYWWKPSAGAGYVPDTAMGGLLHCILAFRGMAPAQKRAWRALLDYYVFDESADPVAHIPEHRRGILGELDEAQALKVRETIKRYL